MQTQLLYTARDENYCIIILYGNMLHASSISRRFPKLDPADLLYDYILQHSIYLRSEGADKYRLLLEYVRLKEASGEKKTDGCMKCPGPADI
jgi:hypothetical protein